MSKRLIAKAIGITEDQAVRGLPFFGVYLLLFTGLTIGDATSVALFASRVGAERLPVWYTLTAIGSLLFIGGYLLRVNKTSSGRMFSYILAVTGSIWLGVWVIHGYVGTAAYGILFVSREIALTMVLMHFGTFLQDYFTRTELDRILPAIYAGGRCGGIFGGAVVSMLSQRIGLVNLILVAIGLFATAIVGIRLIVSLIPTRDEPEDLQAGTPLEETTNSGQAIRSFLKKVVSIPLLYWLTITTLTLVVCRWLLMYQYTAGFESYFANEEDLAKFLGVYAQVALSISLVMQLFIVPRLVAYFGVANSHSFYQVCVFCCFIANLLAGGLWAATASRFVEAELRYGLRNPLNQMMVNRFPKKQRISVRGWSLGWLIPVGTLMASGVIAAVQRMGGLPAIAWFGCLLGLALVYTGLQVGKAYDQYGRQESVDGLM